MSDNKLQSQIDAVLSKALHDKKPENPLNVLHSQLEKKVEPETASVTSKMEVSQKPLRTYEGDIAEAMAQQKASIATMVIAENQKKFEKEKVKEEENKKETVSKPSSHAGKKVFLTLLSIIFIGSGIAGGYYMYLQSPLVPDPVAIPVIKIPSIVPPDIQQIVEVDSLEKSRFIQTLTNELGKYSLEPNTIMELIPGQRMGSTTTKRITGSQFIESVKFEMPDILKRSLTDRWMLGLYSGNDMNVIEPFPFIIFETDFFQNSFAGMLKWESKMPDDLSIILDYEEKARYEDNISTTSIASYFGIRGNFEDKVIRNRDIREFVNSNGEILFLYTFLNKDTLLITTSEAVIPAILDRIEKQTYIR